MQAKLFLREPLFHFFLLGVVLFIAYDWASDGGPPPEDVIVVDAARVAALEAQFERVWQRPPTPPELSGLIDSWVREEVFYRESLALGLDRDDPVLRRRLAQKFEFISENLSESPPTEQDLRDYFVANADEYRLPPRFSFRQVYFDPARRGTETDAFVERSLAALTAGESVSGDATLLPGAMDDASFDRVAGTFGEAFAQSLEDLPVGTWVGPVRSGYGIHLLLVEDRQAGRTPAFAEVESAVDRDFRSYRGRQRKDALYEALLERYTVNVEPGVLPIDGQSGNDSRNRG